MEVDARRALPDEFSAAGVAARAALGVADGAERWDTATRTRVLAWVEQQRGVLAVMESKVLAAERSAGTWALTGDRDLAGFVGRVSRQGRGAGFAAVGQAATLEAMPAVAEAVLDGPVTARHVQEISRATVASPRLAAELATPAGQAELVGLARRLDGARFGKALKRMGASLDPASRQREHDEQQAGRFLHIGHSAGGTTITARLDAVAGHEFAKAVDALNPRPTRDDDRSDAQRRADALMLMVHRTLTDRSTTPGAVAPIHAVITFSEETWTALRAERVPRGPGIADAGPTATGNRNGLPGKGSTADVVTALRGMPSVTDEDGRAWPASEIARALCDCALTRAVVGGPGMSLDLGRGDRFFRTQHWLALYASGQTTCAWPGCSMPLRYAELHHMRWWDRDGGRTAIDNCAPLCRFHHQYVHDHDVSMSRLPDGGFEHRDRQGRLVGELSAAAPPPARGDP